MARPLSMGFQISDSVPAPTAWMEPAAPPERIRVTISIEMELDTAETAVKTTKKANDSKSTVRRPKTSEKPDHQMGKIARESR